MTRQTPPTPPAPRHEAAASAARLAQRIAGPASLAALLAGAAIALAPPALRAGEEPYLIEPPALDEPASPPRQEVAVFAGGCFWGVQAVFQHVEGVGNALSGYAGGQAGTATYERIGRGDTGHAESVQVSYDPSVVTYGQLLQIYFSVAHDPTQHNRQGPDVGTQYRSTIFAADAEQRRIAQAYIAQLDASGAYPRPLATTVEDLDGFYPAEAYHQDYLQQHPDSPYIVYNDLPKLENLARVFGERYRETPVLVGR